MITKPKIPIDWAPDELKFINDNFYNTSLNNLLQGINDFRINPVELGALRHQIRRMDLSKGIQIRWHQDDTAYLIENYKIKGNKEIGIDLTLAKRTFRIIGGKMVYRTFNKKNVEKKMELLGLKRTPIEVHKIKQRNIELGLAPAQKSDDNYWTQEIRKKAIEEEIRIWKRKDDNHYSLFRSIKINNAFIPYSRWFYQKYIGPIPAGYIVFHKDFDTLNDEPDNLDIRKRCRISREVFANGLRLLETREKDILKQLSKVKSRTAEKNLMSDILRIRGVMKYLKQKLKLALPSEIAECINLSKQISKIIKDYEQRHVART